MFKLTMEDGTDVWFHRDSIYAIGPNKRGGIVVVGTCLVHTTIGVFVMRGSAEAVAESLVDKPYKKLDV